MCQPISYFRAESLLEGEGYFFRLRGNNKRTEEYVRVTFISYTTCPAIVVVQDGGKERIRCCRMDLYIVK
jgi:hypothetical protein